MIAIITVQDGKDHVHRTGSRFDGDLLAKVSAANTIICNYLQIDETASPLSLPSPWASLNSIPWDIHAATLIVFADLVEFREGNLSLNGNREFDPISPAVISLLKPYRDPSMA